MHFTFTGNIGKVQNLENVILGFRNAGLHHAQLNIFGDGSNLEHLKKVVDEGQIQHVVFYGRVPLDEIKHILSQSDVLLISLMPDPVMELTLPLKFPTYLSSSKPIYALMRGEVGRIVREYRIGEVADPLNIDEIAKGFRKFNLSTDRKEEIKKQCQSLVSSVYNRRKIINEITNIFFK